MRSMRIEKAPLRRRWPDWSAEADCGAETLTAGVAENASLAVAEADSREFLRGGCELLGVELTGCDSFGAGDDFVEELKGDSLGTGSGGVNRKQRPVGHGPLVGGEVGNDGLERLIAEVFAEFGEIGLLVGPAGLVAADEIPQQAQPVVVTLADVLDGGRDVLGTESTPACRLQRNDDRVRRTQSRVAHKRQRRGTVKEDEVVITTKRSDRFGQREVEIGFLPPVTHVDRLQPGGRGNDVNAVKPRPMNQRSGVRLNGRIEQLLNRSNDLIVVKKTARQIRLGVEINEQDTLTGSMSGRRDQPAGMCLADATFPVQRS